MLLAGLESAPNEGVRAWFTLLSIVAENLGILSLCGGLLIALLRYRLYDAEAAISRSGSMKGAPHCSSGRVVPRPSERFVPSSKHCPG